MIGLMFFSFVFFMLFALYWIGKFIGRGFAYLFSEWSFKFVNSPAWLQFSVYLITCLILFIFMVGDEMYAKYRIETLCEQARKELPKADKNQLSNRIFIKSPRIKSREKFFYIKIIGLENIYLNSENNQKVFENKEYRFINGLLTRFFRKILPSNTINSVAYSEKNAECVTEIPNLIAWNSKIIWKK